jgi:hypothetical protein
LSLGASAARPACRRLAGPAWLIVAAALSLLAGCPGDLGGAGHGALDPTRSAAQIDLRQLDARPRLTLIARDGDPAPALVVAVVAQTGATWNTALAALLEQRLSAAGHSVESRADALGFRLDYTPPTTDSVAEFFLALARAAASPVGRNDPALPLVADRLAALTRQPLDHPSQSPIAACSGQLGILASVGTPKLTTANGLAALEAARRRALVIERSSIAAVGPVSFTGEVVTALQASEGWQNGTAAGPQWPSGEHHGAYLSADLPQGRAQLDIAMRTPSALRAVSAVKRAAQPASPLKLKLAATDPAWQMEQLRATAHAHGGCVHLRLGAAAAGFSDSLLRPAARQAAMALPDSATRVARLVAAEFELGLDQPPTPFDVTGEIIGAADPHEAAARAAWWALSAGDAAQQQPVLATALAVSAHGKEPLPLTDEQLDVRYRTAMGEQPGAPLGAGIGERRLAVERGQGELWLLVASPCALAQEGSWDAGRTALVALTAAAEAGSQHGVTIEPWVTPDGVGLIAHGGLARDDEPPAALARRVGAAAGQALLGLSTVDQSFGRAKGTLLAMLGRDGASGYWALAEAVAPNHPVWLAPWGSPERQLGVTAEDVLERWRELLHAPLRIAVLGNADLAQAELAASQVDRWLLSDARSRPCSETPALEPARPGRHPIPPSPSPLGQLLLAVPLSKSDSAQSGLAPQLVAALQGDQGLLRRQLPHWPSVSARLLGGAAAPALVIEVRAPRKALSTAQARVTKLLVALSAGGLSEADRKRAHASTRDEWLARHRRPAERLANLWRGVPMAEVEWDEPSEAQWRAWLSKTLRASRLVVVTDDKDAP